MAEYIEREAVNMDGCSELNKIKTDFAQIIVCGTAEKPYYNIMYFDPKDREIHIGWGSYYLDYVFKWLQEEFEIVGDEFSADVVEVVRCKDCKYFGFCGEATNLEVMGFYGFCSRGERKNDAE